MKNIVLIIFLCTVLVNIQAKATECIFGKEINSLTEERSNTFNVQYLGEFVKIARSEVEGSPVRVMVYELTEKATNNVFHLNYTYEDEFDGGNSIGWIENFKTLELVARIQDSAFYDCKITK